MALDTAKVTTRANSDLCNVERFLTDTSLSPAARMELIALVADGFKAATAGSVGHHTAVKEATARFPLLWKIAHMAGLR